MAGHACSRAATMARRLAREGPGGRGLTWADAARAVRVCGAAQGAGAATRRQVQRRWWKRRASGWGSEQQQAEEAAVVAERWKAVLERFHHAGITGARDERLAVGVGLMASEAERR